MIDSISLEHVGPSSKMTLQFGSRLNLLTGDNGLGKSFVLDLACGLDTDLGRIACIATTGEKGKPTIEYCLWENPKRRMLW